MLNKVLDWYQYSGAVHVHTTESDGTRPWEDVVVFGNEVGLDFLMFCDHMNLNNRDNNKEGIYNGLLAVSGYEHNDSDDIHHYLLFDSPRVYPSDMTPAEYVAAGAEDGAIGILAHPDEIRSQLKEYPPYPWNDWSADRFTGMEIWNQMSEWMERLSRFNKLAMAFSPRKSMVGPTNRILQKWDELNMTRKVVGIAGVDAHAFLRKVGPFEFRIFPYKVHFKCLRTHLILDEPFSTDFETARNQLYQAIRECRAFFSNMRWGAAESFACYIENATGRATCGDEIVLDNDTCLKITLPEKATLKVVHDGHYCFEKSADNLEYQIVKPGIYRVEAWKGKRGWVFSNHIRVTTAR